MGPALTTVLMVVVTLLTSGTVAGTAALSAPVPLMTPGVTPRLNANFKAGAGAGTKLSDMGLTQSASMTQTAGFVSRLPAHGIQTITNMGANAILSDGDVKAVRNAALGSLATIVGTEATLPLGQAYHAGQVNPFVHKVLHGGIGAGTAAISGGNVWAGAAGAVAGELAGEVYLGTQTPTLQNTNHLIRQAANIGRVAGGLAGLVAGRDVNTGANTGTIASENNAVGILIPAVPAVVETTIAGLGAAGRACMANPTCAAAVRNAASYLIPDIVAQFQGQSGNAQVQPAQEANNQQAPQSAPPPPEPENDGGKNKKENNLSKEDLKSIRSLEKQIEKHEQKLKDFKNNPTVRPGMEDQSQGTIEAQRAARIRHLETEIRTFRRNINKIRGDQ